MAGSALCEFVLVHSRFPGFCLLPPVAGLAGARIRSTCHAWQAFPFLPLRPRLVRSQPDSSALECNDTQRIRQVTICYDLGTDEAA